MTEKIKFGIKTINKSKSISDEITVILTGLKEIIFDRIYKQNIKPTPVLLIPLKFPAAHLIRIILENLLTGNQQNADNFIEAMQTRVHLPGDFIPFPLAVHLANYLNELICLEQEAGYYEIFYSTNQRDIAKDFVREIQVKFGGK